jgi:radical SAM superfamily enzyme YgiQ (UPF0313 family)
MKGYPIVLTADRCLMADYDLLFDGMLAASQTTSTPRFIMDSLLMPRLPEKDLRAVCAPLGLRRIEASLLQASFDREDVIVVSPEHLEKAVGDATKIIGISSGEPAGFGMNSSTMCGIAGGGIYPQILFEELMKKVRKLRASNPQIKVILGGPGAWQLKSEDARGQTGIDHVFMGYAEGNIGAVFHDLLIGKELPRIIEGKRTDAARIPAITGASAMGVVEISRGCGLGCAFCTIHNVPMIHLPHKTILQDVRTNVENGRTSIAALSEDFFRYGSRGMNVQPKALLDLLQKIREIPGLRLIQIDHCNILSVSRYSDGELKTIRELMTSGQRHNYPWVNVGVETASGDLLQKNGGIGKIGPSGTERWGEFSAEQLRRLCSAGFFPLVSLIIGLPGETSEDVVKTITWVEGLKRERLSIFPVLYAPIRGEEALTVHSLTPLHWELIRKSYDYNFKWVPGMYWDNQTGAGVSLFKRLLMQGMGRAQALEWSCLITGRGWLSRKRQTSRGNPENLL